MYDHQTESLWLQIKREAVTGPMIGTRLKRYPSTVTTWKKWRKRYPDTEVLSLKTGHKRDYNKDPYESYYQSRQGFFSFMRKGPGATDKALVVGVEIDDHVRAYPLDLLRKEEVIKDELADKKIEVVLDKITDTVSVKILSGETLSPIITYWFIWQGIHPDTELFSEKKESP